MNGKSETQGANEFSITRVVDAPRELVFAAWTEVGRLTKWFGPKGCTISHGKMDLRPGGVFHFCMKGPDGREMWGKWVFREIVPLQRIVLVNSFSDEKGGMARHPMSPTWPKETLSTTTFTDESGKTKIHLRWSPLNPTDDERKTFDGGHASMNMGWSGTFEQLETYLAELKK